TLVEAALNIESMGAMKHPLRIADIGTGSGAILLALLSEMPDTCGVGTDIDEDALQTSAHNAQSLGLARRVTLVRCSYTQALRGPFDVIVSNPPYIPSDHIAALDVEVRDHDPLRALDGGADGLDAYRAIAAPAIDLLKTGGALLFEVGQ